VKASAFLVPMDKPSQLLIQAAEVYTHVRLIAADITDEEHKMVSDLFECILQFPIVKNNSENTTREETSDN
jgi:hypothetical protein